MNTGQLIDQREVESLFSKFAEPLRSSIGTAASEASTNALAASLWKVMLGGSEAEQAFWASLDIVDNLEEKLVGRLRQCYDVKMKQAITGEELFALREQYSSRESVCI